MRARTWILPALALAVLPTSGRASIIKPEVVSPGGTEEVPLIASPCPSFSWGAVPRAAAYELVVYRIGERNEPVEPERPRQVLLRRVAGSALSWTPALDQCFEPGRRYAWAARALDQAGDPGPWSNASLFEVAAAPSPADVRRALEVLGAYLRSAKSTESTRAGRKGSEAAAASSTSSTASFDDGPELPRTRSLGPASETALRAEGVGTTGVVFGLHGLSKSTTDGSVGVAGESTAAAGDTAGVFGQAASAAGAAGVFDNTASGDILRGLAAGAEVFSVEGSGAVLATSFAGDGSNLTGLDPASLSAGTAAIDISGNAATATSATNAADADTVDSKHAADFVLEAGDVMTGSLELPADGLIAGTTQLVLDGGKVGIGTASPTEPLHIADTGPQLILEDTASGADRHIVQFGISSGEVVIAANHIPVAATSLGMKLQVRDGGSALDALKILPSGFVGIGDDTPTHRLDVGGDVTVGADTETLSNGAFSLSGDDLFVAGLAGVEGTIFTDSGVTVGASTTFADGTITQSTAGSGLAIDVAGGDAAGENLTVTANNVSISAAGTVTATSFTGSGSGLTGVAAATAAALAGDGANCVAGQFAAGVGADGAAQDCAVPGDANHTFATDNTRVGQDALAANTTGASNTGLGADALAGNTGGNRNTAAGASALAANTTGSDNAAHGYRALASNLDGVNNAAFGHKALEANTGGDQNTALGTNALLANTTGNRNTAVGQALQANSSGAENTGIGHFALRSNTTGSRNVAAGRDSMYANDTGYQNTAMGMESLRSNTSGAGNTAAGYQAVRGNLDAVSNTGIGTRALFSNTTGDQNTAVGARSLYSNTGLRNTALGYRAGVDLTTGSDNIHIGNYGLAGETAKIKIGRQGTQTATHIAGIFGTPLAGSAVVVTSSGQLGTAAGATGDADTVDGFHAAAAAAAGSLLALDGSAKLPASITGDADTVGGKHASDLVDKAGDTMTGALNLPANGLAVGTSQLTVAGGRVGVNTASPTETLEVDGSAKATAFLGDGSGLTGLPQRVLVAHDEFDRETVDPYWTAATSGLGTVEATSALSQIRLDSGLGGSGSVNLIGDQSFVLSSGPLVFRAKLGAYQDAGGIYGDGQPRGLADGTDRNNAIEFVSASQTSVTARTVSGGTATETTVGIGGSVYGLNFYQIVATATKVKFWVNGTLIATHTTNIPSTALNVYVGTDYAGFGTVPVDVDFLSLERID